MPLTAQQEAYLGKLADKGLAQEAFEAKIPELEAAKDSAYSRVPKSIRDGATTKLGILTLRAAVSADPEVARIEAELISLKAVIK